MSIGKWFRNMRLQSKIIMLVTILIIFTGVIGIYSIINVNTITENTELLGLFFIPRVQIGGKITEGLANIRLSGLRHMMTNLESEFKQHEDAIAKDKLATQKAFEELKPLLRTKENQQKHDLMMQQWNQFIDMTEEILSLSRSKAIIASHTLDLAREERGEVADELAKNLEDLMAVIERETNETVADSMTAAATGRTAIIGILVALIVIGFILGIFIARNIANPVMELVKVVNKTASGDFTENIESQSTDEIGNLMNAFGNMVKDLRGIIGQTAASAETIASTSEELAAAAEESASAVHQISSTVGEISAGIEEQTASTNQTAASVHQSNQAIAQVAEGAEAQVRHVHETSNVLNEMKKSMNEVIEVLEKVNKASTESAQSAELGGQSMENLIAGMAKLSEAGNASGVAMSELDTHVQDIGKILGVIEDIAEQTNLLALNAAIEAARAGEHGRGFAVVADEVRKLAERSSVETKAIAELITAVTQASGDVVKAVSLANEQVEAGNNLTVEAKTVLEEIVANARDAKILIENLIKSVQDLAKAGDIAAKSIDEVVGISEENTAAAEEMAAQADEVEKAMDSIASVSEESAASVAEISASTEQVTASIEQIATSSQELANMAEKLIQAVGVFKVK